MKKRCFVGLGGAGKNSLNLFFKNEKKADFLVIDEGFDALCDYQQIDCKSETQQNILKYFEQNCSYVFLLGLSYSKNKHRTGVRLMKMIGEFLNQKNKPFIMILGLPFAFEYGKTSKPQIDKLRQELECLAPKTLIADLEVFQKKYGNKEISMMCDFHYMIWQSYKDSHKKTYLRRTFNQFLLKIKHIIKKR